MQMVLKGVDCLSPADRSKCPSILAANGLSPRLSAASRGSFDNRANPAGSAERLKHEPALDAHVARKMVFINPEVADVLRDEVRQIHADELVNHLVRQRPGGAVRCTESKPGIGGSGESFASVASFATSRCRMRISDPAAADVRADDLPLHERFERSDGERAASSAE